MSSDDCERWQRETCDVCGQGFNTIDDWLNRHDTDGIVYWGATHADCCRICGRFYEWEIP